MLTQNFLNELFKLCFYKKEVLESVSTYLKYSYIPVEIKEYKFILQSIVDQYSETGKLPTLGVISQKHSSNMEVQEVIMAIKTTDIKDSSLILNQLEVFIKDTMMINSFNDIYELANHDKMAEAQTLYKNSAEELTDFSISKGTSKFMKLRADFEDNRREKIEKKERGDDKSEKVPFGIVPLDILTGGMDITDTALMIMRSGVGKSTFLKWCGMYACRMGHNVLHIQAEGSKEEAYDKYTQVWAGLSYNEAKWANFSDAQLVKMRKVIKDLEKKDRDLYIEAYEQFGAISMLNVRQSVLDYEKERGCFPDLIIIDSLDLVLPGDGRKYGPNDLKAQMQSTSKKMKNLATEFKSRVLTATQTSDIKFEKWNDPDYVITRSDAMGDKNIANAFSYVFSGNQTVIERKNHTIRLGIDKFRNYSMEQGVYPIATNYEKGRFYNPVRTKKMFDCYAEDK